MSDLPPNLRHRLIVVREMSRIGLDDRSIRRRADSGEIVRVRRGCYLPRADWEVLDRRGRHLVQAHAVASNATIEPVFSHATAAALHGIPLVGSLGTSVHVTIDASGQRRRQPDLVVHQLRLDVDEIDRVDGLLVTNLTRTLLDLALSQSFQNAVAAMDWALGHGVSRADLHAALEDRGVVKRAKAAAAVIEFADGRSGSPGESVSRGVMHLLGCEVPELQIPLSDQGGLIGVVDFYWPDQRLIGEFDGEMKYRSPELLGGRSPVQVVVDEKRREDRMRATGQRFIRWGWREANDPSLLADLLRGAGVPGIR